jgi:hypothetical protein
VLAGPGPATRREDPVKDQHPTPPAPPAPVAPQSPGPAIAEVTGGEEQQQQQQQQQGRARAGADAC